MVAGIAESVVEAAALGWFEGLSYIVLAGPDIAPDEPQAERMVGERRPFGPRSAHARVETMGLGWPSQFKRLQKDPILSEGMIMTVIPSPRGAQETVCLKLELVNGWLFGRAHGGVGHDPLRTQAFGRKNPQFRTFP